MQNYLEFCAQLTLEYSLTEEERQNEYCGDNYLSLLQPFSVYISKSILDLLGIKKINQSLVWGSYHFGAMKSVYQIKSLY